MEFNTCLQRLLCWRPYDVASKEVSDHTNTDSSMEISADKRFGHEG